MRPRAAGRRLSESMMPHASAEVTIHLAQNRVIHPVTGVGSIRRAESGSTCRAAQVHGQSPHCLALPSPPARSGTAALPVAGCLALRPLLCLTLDWGGVKVRQEGEAVYARLELDAGQLLAVGGSTSNINDVKCGSGGWIRHLLARLPRRTRDPAVAGSVTPNRNGALQDRVR